MPPAELMVVFMVQIMTLKCHYRTTPRSFARLKSRGVAAA
jgi:hypothetical protein